MMCIGKYVTCLWDYALYDDCPKRSKGCVDAQPTRLAYDTVDGLVSQAMEHWMLIIWTRKDLARFDIVESESR